MSKDDPKWTTAVLARTIDKVPTSGEAKRGIAGFHVCAALTRRAGIFGGLTQGGYDELVGVWAPLPEIPFLQGGIPLANRGQQLARKRADAEHY